MQQILTPKRSRLNVFLHSSIMRTIISIGFLPVMLITLYLFGKITAFICGIFNPSISETLLSLNMPSRILVTSMLGATAGICIFFIASCIIGFIPYTVEYGHMLLRALLYAVVIACVTYGLLIVTNQPTTCMNLCLAGLIVCITCIILFLLVRLGYIIFQAIAQAFLALQLDMIARYLPITQEEISNLNIHSYEEFEQTILDVFDSFYTHLPPKAFRINMPDNVWNMIKMSMDFYFAYAMSTQCDYSYPWKQLMSTTFVADRMDMLCDHITQDRSLVPLSQFVPYYI